MNSSSNEQPETAEPPAKTKASPRARLTWALRLLAGIALIGFLLWRGDTSSLQGALKTVSPFVLLASVLVYLGGQVLSAWKWQLLLKAQGKSLPLRECCRLYLVGMFWNLWMPTNIGGDGVRAFLAAPQTGGMAIAASSILVERITGFLALLVLAVVGIFGDSIQHRGANASAVHIVLVTIVVFALFFAALALLRRSSSRPADGTEGKLRRKIGQVLAALAFYASREQKATLIRAMAISLAFQASQILLNIALAHAVGLAIPFAVFWWLIPVLSLASLIPLGIGGLGVREAAAVSLLHGSSLLAGAPSATIIAWSLLWQATIWLSSLPGGIWAVKTRRPAPQ